MTDYRTDPDFATQMDAQDSLRSYRDQFHFPQTDDGQQALYFCGHSLGLQPKATAAAVQQELADWQDLGVRGHMHARNPWIDYHEFLTDSFARLVGANPSEVVAMNTLTVNLHLLMVSFYRPTKARHKIVIEGGAFPSDQYAVQSQIRFHGYDPKTSLIELTPRDVEATLRTEDILQLIDDQGDEIALIMLGGVNYYTGQLFDMPAITKAGHDKGCVVGFDLAHAVGNVPLRLHDWDVDFACWCTYKYLNSGPGAVAGAFVHDRHKHADLPRFHGWWGHHIDTRFQMGPNFEPAGGAETWQLSNPPILSLAAVKASLEIFDAVGMDALRDKSLKLTGYAAFLLNNLPTDKVRIMTPTDPNARGAMLSIQIAGDGKAVFEGLSNAGIICDWREPDCIRLTPVPMYNSFTDVHTFVQRFAEQLGVAMPDASVGA